jgi:hypothetical protein
MEAPAIQQLYGSHIHIPTINKELASLRSKQYFGQFDHTMDFDSLDFSIASETMETTAPNWHTFLQDLLANERSRRPSYYTPSSQNKYGPVFMITAMVCFAQAHNTSNFLPALLDTYLLGSGVKRRVLGVLSGLGICHSYKAASKMVGNIAEDAKVRIE